MESINIKKLVVGSLQENCYLVWGDDKKAIVIDPGDEGNRILGEIKNLGLDVAYVVNTHCHWDHTAANAISRQLGAELLIHESDAYALETKPDAFIEDGQEIVFGSNKARVIHTPGHTEGSVCLETEGNLFTGDTLFSGSIGRTDLPGGSTTDILNSLEKLKWMDKNLKVHPGHGPETTIARELKTNPYMTNTAYLK